MKSNTTNDLQGSNILVVDDAPENLRILAAVLERGGFEPRPVPSGKLRRIRHEMQD